MYIHIEKGAKLYRAAPTIETKLRTRHCSDTGKTGVYFSLFHPYLAETMAMEYGRDMYITVYETTANLKVIHGKYSSTRNVSHADMNVEPFHDTTTLPNTVAIELFLTSSDLGKITYTSHYHVTLDHVIKTWYS